MHYFINRYITQKVFLIATKYLPSEKLSKIQIFSQHSNILQENIFHKLIDNLPFPFLILNEKRQIVYYNKSFFDNYNFNNNEDILGLRPGDSFNCINSIEEEGCGTTEFFKYCGGAKAIIARLACRSDTQECRITTTNQRALDFRVWTFPININNEKFTAFTLIDISNEKRREVPERILFHDILNTANGLKGLLEILPELDSIQRKEVIELAQYFVNVLFEEIDTQRTLTLAESGKLEITSSKFSSNDLILDSINFFKYQSIYKDLDYQFESLREDKNIIITDKKILRRAINNLVKNAIEASKINSFINITLDGTPKNYIIKVFNSEVMSDEVKAQIFQRSFSTKGKGRGLGTYSVKLLTEEYLIGKISFISAKDFGTEFTLILPQIISKNETFSN